VNADETLLRDVANHLAAPVNLTKTWFQSRAALASRVDAELAKPSVDYSDADLDRIAASYGTANVKAG
jgi:hypothetical protein